MPKYYEISEETARRSHEAMSMSDYKTGSATAEYRAAVDSAAELVEEQKKRVSPFYHDKLDALLDRYARRLADWTNAHNRNGASCPSVLVAGFSNFPTRKKERQNAREDSLWREYQEIQTILDKIKSVGTGPVDPTDPHAREILEERLQKLQNTLDRGKAMNAHYRKHKTMRGFPGLTDEGAQRLDKELADAPSFARAPFPSFELSSLRNKIKRTQENLSKLADIEEHKNDAENVQQFDGGHIVHNMEQNRLQIIFDEIPDADTRAALKSEGFRWSPRNQAWQRQLTRNAEAAARRVLNIPATTEPTTTEPASAEDDDFSDIDPAAVRAELERRGDNSPFVQRVMEDVERIAAREAAEEAAEDLPAAANGQLLFPQE